jgi:hypothetical protein
MNVFEDLIDELKEENLLEETVLKNRSDDEYLGAVASETSSVMESGSENLETHEPRIIKESFEAVSAGEFQFSDKNSNTNDFPEEQNSKDALHRENENLAKGNLPLIFSKDNKAPQNEKEFYKKRAIEEVSGLQMVEHILSGIEREQMKIVPSPFNDISAKKALHDFLQVAEDVKSPDHALAEFQLMQETETWCSALSVRDKKISVMHLRRFCETTKPPLSSQALISLARFYRNLPYSESVRAKFDFIVTKLFSKEIEDEKRVLVFERNQLIDHLKELYAEWSSIPLYSTDDDDSEIVLAALKFEDFMQEAESAESFDELVKNDFFDRLRMFKESANEVFFAPLVTATAIECNVRVGNSYVSLLESEREKMSAANLQDKYGVMHDQALSDSTSKTLQLVELLKENTNRKERAAKAAGNTFEDIAAPVAAKKAEIRTAPKPPAAKTDKKAKKGSSFEVNKWLLAATILIIMASGGLYFWANYFGAEPTASTNVKKVNLENSSLKEFIQTARISDDTFYGVTLPSWDAMSLEKKEELLKKIFSFGSDKGYVKVHLVNKEGIAVGYATAEKVEVIAP